MCGAGRQGGRPSQCRTMVNPLPEALGDAALHRPATGCPQPKGALKLTIHRHNSSRSDSPRLLWRLGGGSGAMRPRRSNHLPSSHTRPIQVPLQPHLWVHEAQHVRVYQVAPRGHVLKQERPIGLGVSVQLAAIRAVQVHGCVGQPGGVRPWEAGGRARDQRNVRGTQMHVARGAVQHSKDPL